MFPFEDFFHPGKQTKAKATLGEIGWIGRVRHRGHLFLVKTAEHSAWYGQVHSWIARHGMGKHIERVPQKFTEAKCSLSQQRQLVHSYSWVPKTLSYWGKPVLQGAHPPEDNSRVLGGPLCHVLESLDHSWIWNSAYLGCAVTTHIWRIVFAVKPPRGVPGRQG